jgi:hypothetical protein
MAVGPFSIILLIMIVGVALLGAAILSSFSSRSTPTSEKPTPIPCRKCGFLNRRVANYCAACGQPLDRADEQLSK